MQKSMQKDYRRDAAGFAGERRVRIRGVEVRLALGVGLALLSSLIPFMNIFLTPFFILGGLFLSWRYWNSGTLDASEATTET